MKSKVSFRKRPVSLSVDYRPIWKIGQLLLIIRNGSSKSGCSLLKLHLFSWVFQEYRNKKKLQDWIRSDFQGQMTLWTLSPHVNRAVAFAVGEGLVKEVKGRYTLTEKGEKFIQHCMNSEDVYVEEKKVLEKYGRIISDTKIEKLAKRWQ